MSAIYSYTMRIDFAKPFFFIFLCLQDVSEDVCPGLRESDIKEELEDEVDPCIQEKEEPEPPINQKEEEHSHIKEKEEKHLHTKEVEKKSPNIKEEKEEQNICKLPLTGGPLKCENEGQSEASKEAGPPGNSSCPCMTSEGDGGSQACETDKGWQCSECGKTCVSVRSL